MFLATKNRRSCRRSDDSDFGNIGKPVRGGEQDAVVHDGNPRFLRAVDAPQDFAPRQHTAAAMNDERNIGVFVQTECRAGGKDEVKLLPAGKFRERLGNLYSTDIIALAVMRAALGNKHSIAILEILDRRERAFRCFRNRNRRFFYMISCSLWLKTLNLHVLHDLLFFVAKETQTENLL